MLGRSLVIKSERSLLLKSTRGKEVYVGSTLTGSSIANVAIVQGKLEFPGRIFIIESSWRYRAAWHLNRRRKWYVIWCRCTSSATQSWNCFRCLCCLLFTVMNLIFGFPLFLHLPYSQSPIQKHRQPHIKNAIRHTDAPMPPSILIRNPKSGQHCVCVSHDAVLTLRSALWIQQLAAGSGLKVAG